MGMAEDIALLNRIAATELKRPRCNHPQRKRVYHPGYYRCIRCGGVVKIKLAQGQ